MIMKNLVFILDEKKKFLFGEISEILNIVAQNIDFYDEK